MAAVETGKTIEDMLALEAKGIDCELIRGELRIRGVPQNGEAMTTRSYPHSLALINLGYLLRTWLERQPRPRGVVVGGEVRVRIHRDPDTFVGIDLALISADLAARTPKKASFIDGPPLMAVEIISPTDTAEGIADKIRDHLDAGVALVWEVNPFYETVLVHRPDAEPEFFNRRQEISGEPHLPGFRVPVADIFAA
jgi:Uma2 family endonuclease